MTDCIQVLEILSRISGTELGNKIDIALSHYTSFNCLSKEVAAIDKKNVEEERANYTKRMTVPIPLVNQIPESIRKRMK